MRVWSLGLRPRKWLELIGGGIACFVFPTFLHLHLHWMLYMHSGHFRNMGIPSMHLILTLHLRSHSSSLLYSLRSSLNVSCYGGPLLFQNPNPDIISPLGLISYFGILQVRSPNHLTTTKTSTSGNPAPRPANIARWEEPLVLADSHHIERRFYRAPEVQ
jgi:hypothetical protein